ncbi:MAG: 2-C-methyl-D-erythritol 4-phosphate cytidylyltransferase [Deltaproteobacteria bacterium]|nr:2-C-methyl-D-erythritol 4-phosphate cytidylyltransferase [Deltaproteobacteria bacterium]
MVVNAVVVAAGKGERMGAVLPKPFLPVVGVPLFVHTLRSLSRSSFLRKLVLVIAAEYEPLCCQLLERHGPFRLPITLVHGGLERQDSVRLGLAALDPDCDIVVIHDAARPFIAVETIDASVRVAAQHGGALVAIPARDTIKRVNPDGLVVETVPRHDLWLAQTPQTFRVALIKEAHARAQAQGVTATDDAALLEWAGGTVKIVPGDGRNFKLTTPEDLPLAEALLGAEQDNF